MFHGEAIVKKYLRILPLFLCLSMLSPATASAQEWYQGGTLHKATVGEWYAADPQNCVATVASMIANSTSKENIEILTEDEWKEATMATVSCFMDATENKPETAEWPAVGVVFECMKEQQQPYPWMLSKLAKPSANPTPPPANAAPTFEIIDQQKLGTIKMTMVMTITAPVDKPTLTALAQQLYADFNGKKYEKVFMEWYLPGMQRGSGAWAVTNFMPGLSVNILR